MKKIILASILLLGILIASPVFARVDIDYYIDNGLANKNENKNAIDLQKQVDELNQRNAQLELRLIKLEQVPVQTTASQVTQTSLNDAGQTQRIDTLEKRMTLIEKTLQNVSGAISNTIDLIKKLLAKL